MALDDITEVKEAKTDVEANQYLSTGCWRLINVKIDKLRVHTGTVKVEYSGGGELVWQKDTEKYEPVYEERLSALYVLGRYK